MGRKRKLEILQKNEKVQKISEFMCVSQTKQTDDNLSQDLIKDIESRANVSECQSAIVSMNVDKSAPVAVDQYLC